MRLEPKEIEAIRRAAQEVFGAAAVIRVFGSRVDDKARGGDLDLYVEVEPGQATLANETRFLDLVAGPLDELHVDLLLHERGAPLQAIERVALQGGIVL
jgi:predicted nucleotidyltransferase